VTAVEPLIGGNSPPNISAIAYPLNAGTGMPAYRPRRHGAGGSAGERFDMTPQTIGVIGAGLMGHGIAYLLAAAGHTVRIYDPSAQWRDTLRERLESARELLGGDPALLGRISAHDAMAPTMHGASFVFEAAPEKLPLKQELFAELERLTAPDAILASNSSAIPSTRIGEKLKHRERVIGTHFWNPPHLVPLVEVIQNEKTSDETVRRTMTLLHDAGRKPVHIRKDIPGFVGNRLQHAIKREAIALVAAGVCDADTIDEVVKSGFGARMAVLGPMEQSDLVGLDLTLDIQNVLLADLDRSTEPMQFLKDKVAAGKVGMRAGEGMRRWTPESADAVRERLRQFLAAQAKTHTTRG
jgi:3-hydroxybutyryl-CoA dehydrogenase